MNEMTPAKPMPPDQSTAASGHVADGANEAEHGDQGPHQGVLDQLDGSRG